MGRVGIPEIAVLEIGLDGTEVIVVVLALVVEIEAGNAGRRGGRLGPEAAEKQGKLRAAMMEGAGWERRDTE